jgi:hypothetical protein
LARFTLQTLFPLLPHRRTRSSLGWPVPPCVRREDPARFLLILFNLASGTLDSSPVAAVSPSSYLNPLDAACSRQNIFAPRWRDPVICDGSNFAPVLGCSFWCECQGIVRNILCIVPFGCSSMDSLITLLINVLPAARALGFAQNVQLVPRAYTWFLSCIG